MRQRRETGREGCGGGQGCDQEICDGDLRPLETLSGRVTRSDPCFLRGSVFKAVGEAGAHLGCYSDFLRTFILEL